ncbi:MAG: OmpH family outer membrane protein [Candidatus Margulisiibacteriota bacterium]
MKRLIAIVLTLAFFGGVALAADFTNIGFIDVQKVFREYKSTEKAQEELGKQEEAFKKEFEESQKKLEQAEKDGKKPSELETMKKDLETKLAPKREKLLKLNEQLTVKLQMEILDSVKKVAKKVGLDVVLDKQVVITGGMDLTEMVVNELNK